MNGAYSKISLVWTFILCWCRPAYHSPIIIAPHAKLQRLPSVSTPILLFHLIHRDKRLSESFNREPRDGRGVDCICPATEIAFPSAYNAAGAGFKSRLKSLSQGSQFPVYPGRLECARVPAQILGTTRSFSRSNRMGLIWRWIERRNEGG